MKTGVIQTLKEIWEKWDCPRRERCVNGHKSLNIKGTQNSHCNSKAHSLENNFCSNSHSISYEVKKEMAIVILLIYIHLI